MAGKIIADIIEAPYDSIRMNVGNVTVLTANSSGLNYIPTGNVNVTIGGANANLTMNILSANGIKFPSSASVTSDANTLDDYEEGTWVPAFTPATGSFTTMTYTNQGGNYVKIGSLVIASFRLRTASVTIGTAGGSYLYISGLPFTSVNDSTDYRGAGSLYSVADWATNKNPDGINVESGTTYCQLAYRSGSATSQITTTPGDLQTGSGTYNSIWGTVIYRTTS
jgi:hypothetical protein